jgi:hypothetical protein
MPTFFETDKEVGIVPISLPHRQGGQRKLTWGKEQGERQKHETQSYAELHGVKARWVTAKANGNSMNHREHRGNPLGVKNKANGKSTKHRVTQSYTK